MAKFLVVRNLLNQLDFMGDEGDLVERRLLTEVCSLRTLPDEAVPDRDAAIQALARAKELAGRQRTDIVEERQTVAAAREAAAGTLDREKHRVKRLEQLRNLFNDLMAAPPVDSQQRGYQLEDPVADLFETFGIDYKRPYRTGHEQVDGFFHFRGFDYITELRWRKEYPNLSDLSTLSAKADRKMASTRGFFMSILGFRQEVVEEFKQGSSTNIILMDGEDLILVLEGRISLPAGLESKAVAAAQKGEIYYKLRNAALTFT
ncbi:MAG: restriction endonuclease [Dehalococcoidia bacterium]